MRGVLGLGIGVAAVGLALAALPGCGGDEPAPSAEQATAAQPVLAANVGNAAPQVETVRLEPRDPKPGDTFRASVQASDPDGDPVKLFFSWSVNGETIDVGGSASFRPPSLRAGDRVDVEVVANDGRLDSAPVRVSASVDNRGPTVRVARIAPAENVRPGQQLEAMVDAEDPDDDPLSFEFTWFVNGESRGRGENVFDTKGLRRGDEVHVRVVARDGSSRSGPMESARIELANSPPVFSGVPVREEVDGVFYYKLEARDPDGDRSLRYRLNTGPTGMSIDPLSGVVRWKPAADQAGVHPVEVVVRDRLGDETFLRWNLSVSVTQSPAAQAASY